MKRLKFTGLDFEMEILFSYHEILDVLESVLLAIFDHLKTNLAADLAIIATQYPSSPLLLPDGPSTNDDSKNSKPHIFPRISFSHAAELLTEAGFTQSPGEDLSTENERALGTIVREKYGSDIFVLDQFPLAARPFYTMPTKPDSSTSTEASSPPSTAPSQAAETTTTIAPVAASNSFDLIMRGQEICSGAQRIHSSSLLRARIAASQHTEKKIDADGEGLRYYLDAFRLGAPRHGGVGLGLERIVMLYLGLPNVKLASLFARDPVRTAP